MKAAAAVVSALACACASAQDAYWSRSAEGWFWYKDPPAREVPDPPEHPERSPSPALAAHERLQDELLELRAVAVMDPTPENVGRYMRRQRHALDLSSEFADQWRRIVWTTPELDYSLHHRPTNAWAAAQHDERARLERTRRLGELARSRGLALFFKADCPLCGAMARILSQLQDRHGFHVTGISADGSDLGLLSDVRPANGIGRLMGVEAYPATFLIDPGTMSAEPVGAGPMSLEEIEERIDVLTHFAPGSRF